MPTPSPAPLPSGVTQDVTPQTWRCVNDSPTPIPNTGLTPQHYIPAYTCSVTAWQVQPSAPIASTSTTATVFSDDAHRIADLLPAASGICIALLAGILISQVRGH